MTRRSFAVGLALSLAALSAAFVAGGAPEPAGARGVPARPNIVVIMTDDQRADDVKVMREVRRRVGSQGVTFRRAFATFPLCCPSRASYLTGQYAHNHGVLSNLPPDGGVERLDDQTTTALALHDAGYRTGWIGKYLNGYFRITPEVPSGYDDWRVLAGRAQMFGWRQTINGRTREWDTGARSYQTDVLARQSKRFIRDGLAGGTPFFLTIEPGAPHREAPLRGPRHDPRPASRHRDILAGHPFPKTAAFNEADVSDKPGPVRSLPRFSRKKVAAIRKQRLARLESLLAVDDLVNSVIRTLKQGDALSRTLVVFTSDNGYQLGEHRHVGKLQVYEESVKVPLLMRGPGVPRGVVTDTLAANIDLPAAIYEASGVASAVPADGVSLFELLADPEAFADRALLIQTFHGLAVRTSGYLYAEQDTDRTTPELDDEIELYDLAADPSQLQSAHDDPVLDAVQAELADRLDELRDCAGASCR